MFLCEHISQYLSYPSIGLFVVPVGCWRLTCEVLMAGASLLYWPVWGWSLRTFRLPFYSCCCWIIPVETSCTAVLLIWTSTFHHRRPFFLCLKLFVGKSSSSRRPHMCYAMYRRVGKLTTSDETFTCLHKMEEFGVVK